MSLRPDHDVWLRSENGSGTDTVCFVRPCDERHAMKRIPQCQRDVSSAGPEILTPQLCKMLDGLATAHTPIATLIDRAGWCVAQAISARFTPARILVLCGPGNNGRDGLAAAFVLARRGWSVQVAFMAAPSHERRAQCQARGINVVAMSQPNVLRADLVVDALLGAGLNRKLDYVMSEALAAARVRVAIDVPSGVEGATGRCFGKALHYCLTVTFVRLKPCHVLQPSRSYMGEIVCADIGISDTMVHACNPTLFLNRPDLWTVPHISSFHHKYERGVVSICAGAKMPGASCLAADGARHSGAGLVRVAAGHAATLYKGLVSADAIVDDAALTTLLADTRRQVWICGPGLCVAEVDAAFATLVKAKRTIVADAGVFKWAEGKPHLLKGASVITPHEGEFTGLVGGISDDRIASARRLAKDIDAVVILKGPATLIASPDGRVAVNAHASAQLATAGSGDTLTGVVSALLANGMERWAASCAAVWIHGEAGFRAGAWPTATDFARHLGPARESAEHGLLNV